MPSLFKLDRFLAQGESQLQEAILLGRSRQPSIQELVGIARLEDWADQLARWKDVKRGSGSPW